jgi:hypothetical protein
MDEEQWDLLWTGAQAFWKAVPHLLAAGYHTAEELTEPRRQGAGRPFKIPRLMAAQEGGCTQTMRIILSRDIRGIDEGLAGSPSDMVDWRSAHVGNARQEGKSEGHPLEQLPTTSECGHHLLQMIIN